MRIAGESRMLCRERPSRQIASWCSVHTVQTVWPMLEQYWPAIAVYTCIIHSDIRMASIYIALNRACFMTYSYAVLSDGELRIEVH